uniref:Transposase MuDR plant domain-containing protein n=1 Tax=Lactuca sativa TaxID=4236 RepID=A0A9R1W9W0_LACSA|nr:hypothetical protein LSAT_V11C300104060 [Lactuca sativa]
MSNMSMEREDGIDLTEFVSPQQSNMEGVSQANGNEDAIEGENPQEDEDENVSYMKGKPMLNEDIPWKKQLLILGMRFTNHKKLEFMTCNYVVANGYQLYYEKNDSKRLLVKCCDGECTFRLWASWMSEEHSFQIKSLINEHNYAKKLKLGSIVNYRWIVAHQRNPKIVKSKHEEVHGHAFAFPRSTDVPETYPKL